MLLIAQQILTLRSDEIYDSITVARLKLLHDHISTLVSILPFLGSSILQVSIRSRFLLPAGSASIDTFRDTLTINLHTCRGFLSMSGM